MRKKSQQALNSQKLLIESHILYVICSFHEDKSRLVSILQILSNTHLQEIESLEDLLILCIQYTLKNNPQYKTMYKKYLPQYSASNNSMIILQHFVICNSSKLKGNNRRPMQLTISIQILLSHIPTNFFVTFGFLLIN